MLWIEEIDFHMMSTNLRENSRIVDLGSENRQQNTPGDSGTNHGFHLPACIPVQRETASIIKAVTNALSQYLTVIFCGHGRGTEDVAILMV